jgi:hypothetical protein
MDDSEQVTQMSVKYREELCEYLEISPESDAELVDAYIENERVRQMRAH